MSDSRETMEIHLGSQFCEAQYYESLCEAPREDVTKIMQKVVAQFSRETPAGYYYCPYQSIIVCPRESEEGGTAIDAGELLGEIQQLVINKYLDDGEI